jgi:hypothetical protein
LHSNKDANQTFYHHTKNNRSSHSGIDYKRLDNSK